MISVIINALLYLLLFRYVWKKKKRLDCSVVLIGLWSLVAVMGVFHYIDEKHFHDHMTLLPFIYLFITFIVYIRYFINEKDKYSSVQRITYYRSNVMDVICYLYIAAVILNIYNDGVTLSSLSTSSLMENGLDLYIDHFDREVVYKGFLDHYSHTYEYYAYVIVLIASFNALCQERYKFALILILVIVLNTLIKASATGGRNQVVALVTLIIGLYSLYYRFFTKKARHYFYMGSLVTGGFLLTYLMAITMSRFDDSDMGAGGSLVSYLGQPMLYFDYGIADVDHGLYYGIRTFKNLAEIIGIKVPIKFDSDILLGTHFGTAFTTNIGMLTLDFGYIGTLLFGIFLPWFMRKLYLYKGELTIPGLYIYIFFFNRMINGAFVNGSGSDYLYWQAFMFYVILWVIVVVSMNGKKRNRELQFKMR